MKKLEIVAYNRSELGTKTAKHLRAEGLVPGVLYGGEKPVHFYAPMILFKDLIYTPEVAFVDLNIEGTVYPCILQDAQFHPVSEVMLHVDFLLLNAGQEVKMQIPVSFVGTSPGVIKGGKLVAKMRKLAVRALPDNMPETIEVNVSKLELGKSIRVGELPPKDYEITTNALVTVASVAIPRALKSSQSKE